MSKLVSTLQEQHRELVQALEEIRKAGLTTPEAVLRLNKLKSTLIAHLRKEDAELYPALRRAGAKHPEAQAMAERFEAEMAGISKEVIAFFEKYANGGSGIDFARDIGRLLGALGTRIRREESELYPAHEKYVGA